MHAAAGPMSVPACPGDTQESRATALCTEGSSLVPQMRKPNSHWGRAAWSQFPRGASCCDCPAVPPEGSDGVCCKCDVPIEHSGAKSQPIMGCKILILSRFAAVDLANPKSITISDTVRVDKHRYTGWFAFNESSAEADWTKPVATELYEHSEAPFPVEWAVEHKNVVREQANAATVARLHKLLVTCGARPDQCPPALLEGLVN